MGQNLRLAFLPRETVSDQTHLSSAACSARGGWGRNHFRANDDKLIWRPFVRVKGAYCQVLEMGPSPASHSTAGDPGPRSHTTSAHALQSWSHAVDAVPRLRSKPWGRVSIRTMHSLCVCHRLKCGQARKGRRRKCTRSTPEFFGRIWMRLHHGNARFFHR